MNRIYTNLEACMGCGLCRVHCQTAHSKTKDPVRAVKRESPRPLPRVKVERQGHIIFSVQCRHCDEPHCARACLTGALHHDSDRGIVVVDYERCIGCWTCVISCPNGALTRDTANHRVLKCDLCPGETEPACMANCPNEALYMAE